ncbi:RND family efflux transporter MFP subunit [Aeromonas diversa CDC 2478-85]|uniref:RND family efflux transporter MFP subunit n=4 Tax=Aeromonas diversa TaxID=502790 RepID=N9VEH6_9GAMM|nr:efflux RND transporter periplasmic adaptor subunit [Aeromonas diversa]ENY73642.1 RND family efflux transporter MFP subunit [Aeromonas diversa CDC 2478-85]
MRALGVLLAMVTLSGCGEAQSSVAAQAVVRPVKLMEVQDERSGGWRRFPATVVASEQAELAFRINGQLVELNLVEGQPIRQGQLLARLDDRDARNTLLNREADYELADADFRRKAALLERKLISQADYDRAKATRKSALAALNSARDLLSYTRLEAPFSGIVAKIELENHQMVRANETVMGVQRNDAIDIRIQAPESLVVSFSGASAPLKQSTPLVRFAADPDRTYPVHYKEHATKVTSGTQSYEVVFTLPRPAALNLLPGMSAELQLQLPGAEAMDAVVLPPAAIDRSDKNGQVRVWRFDEQSGRVSSVPVTLGQVRSDGIEVLGALSRGERVVVAGSQQLKEGMVVKPLRWERGV